jgi:GTP-binding protein EngB required for normal cell division
MNEEILKKLGYNSIALEMLLKREAQISPEDIIMPGDRPNLNRDNSFDDLNSDTKSDIENILNKLDEVKDILNNLPEYTLAEEKYDDDVRAFPMHKRYAKDELENLIEEIKQLQKYA